jgi:D-beta-D-heptose 7-phosphate kinase/D-beta-D-heptose 1-phosphate adenosyltransferase
MDKFYRKNKVITPESALEQLNSDQLVFTCGVYDILHNGHLHFFRKAKEIVGNDGKLVVVIHDDQSVRDHKGENRPINKLEARLDFLSELEAVDYVIPWYGWENIVDFAKKLEPEYFAVTSKSYEHSQKGNWQANTWETVANDIGSKVIKIGLVEGLSSSRYEEILNKLA